MRLMARLALSACGVIGGCMLFHGYSMNKERTVLVWHPHYHALGYVEGDGFDRCRRCVHVREDCFDCDGFKGRQVRGYKKDGYIVKVKAKRETIWGTARYQLDHSCIDVTKKRFRVSTWFGCCSYHKLKVTAELKKSICPCCKHDLEKLRYVGNKSFCLDRSSPNFQREGFDPYKEGGIVVWIVIESRSWRSGNYAEFTVRV